MGKTILMLGTFDSKGGEFNYLYAELVRRGANVIAMDVGVYGSVGNFFVDILPEKVAARGGSSLDDLRAKGDRGVAMRVMCMGARVIARELYDAQKIDGVISMGGGGGTSIATTAMQGLPIGIPKVCVTTLASGDTSEYVGTKDIVLFPSIVDICGINQFSRVILSRAAGAVCGMAAMDPLPDANDRPIICISMFGNSTPCVEKCADLLRQRGYEPLVFHATGGGGRSMEDFILGGHCCAVLDITTTEWADELCGGILSAGPHRLEAAGKMNLPQVIAPGCLDMVNFGSRPTVPAKYADGTRRLYEWNPMVTLMRTNVAENEQLGAILAEKANASKAPVAFLLPLRGVSILDGDGQPFCDWKTDEVLYASLRRHLHKNIPVETVDANLNESAFAKRAVTLLIETMQRENKGKTEHCENAAVS